MAKKRTAAKKSKYDLSLAELVRRAERCTGKQVKVGPAYKREAGVFVGREPWNMLMFAGTQRQARTWLEAFIDGCEQKPK